MLTGLLVVLELLAILRRRKSFFAREKTTLQEDIQQTEDAIRKRKAEIEVGDM